MKLLQRNFDISNRKHIGQLQNALSILDSNLQSDSEDITSVKIGKDTISSIKRTKQVLHLQSNSKLDPVTIDSINGALIRKRLESKRQSGQMVKSLNRAIKIAKTGNQISRDTDFSKEQTSQAIITFQQKYKLSPTGTLTAETIKMIDSVNASIPARKKYLKIKLTEQLNKVRNPLRLNMCGSRVADLQRALSWLGFSIVEEESSLQKFGKSTINAVIEFQKQHNLQITGSVGWKTKMQINELIKSNSRMVPCSKKYRVRGTVRDEHWEPVPHARIEIYLEGFHQETLIAERKTLKNGFYDVQYQPPKDQNSGKAKTSYQLHLKLFDDNNNVIQEKKVKATAKVLWINFTLGDIPYGGESIFSQLHKLIISIAGKDALLHTFEESDTRQDISWLQKETNVAANELTKIILAFRCAHAVNNPQLPADIFYCILHQNMPNNIPGHLYPDTPQEWHTWVTDIVTAITDGIALTEVNILSDLLNNGLKCNYISRSFFKKIDSIISELDNLTIKTILERPILPGKSSLKQLLDIARIQKKKYTHIARHLSTARQFNNTFWKLLEDDTQLTPKDVAGIHRVVEIGHITNNHAPAAEFLSLQVGSSKGGLRLKSTAQFAQFQNSDWINLISRNDTIIPSSINGKSITERRLNYAMELKEHAGSLFPTISLFATLNTSKNHALGDMSRLLRAATQLTEFVLSRESTEKFVSQSRVAFNDHDLAALKVAQRLTRLTESPDIAATLIKRGYFSAVQVYRTGKEQFVTSLKSSGISIGQAETIYSTAELHYATTMAAWANYCFDLNRIQPGCILKNAYTPKEIEDLKGQIPDIETLFGPLESREVKHCASILGPSAYLVDLFRFLDEKKSLTATTSVKDILFERRPDLGTIKLNCQNTNTPLPYIDLVCEILEDRVAGGSGVLELQSTWTAEELQAEPEHINTNAYDILKISNFPIYNSFNLWQEEIGVFFRHFGIQRHELIGTFTAITDEISENEVKLNCAAEFFGISSHELNIIVTHSPSTIIQREFWTEEITVPRIPAGRFINKAGITYQELIALLCSSFVNYNQPRAVITSDIDNVDPDSQLIDHMNRHVLDRANRFLRLWRHTGLAIWELDLLIMSPSVGNKSINANTIINLHYFEELRKKTNLSVEQLLSFYSTINTLSRLNQKDFSTSEKNLFESIFLNGSIEPQTRAIFTSLMSSPPSGNLIDFRTHITGSLGIDSEDFDLLAPLTDGFFSLSSLSILYRYCKLAEVINLPITSLMHLLSITETADPFTTPETTLSLIKRWDLIKSSRLTLTQLRFILTHNPESSSELREESYVRKIGMLRESMSGIRSKMDECTESGGDSLVMLLGMLEPFSTPEAVQHVMGIISGTWSDEQTIIDAFIEGSMGVFLSDTDDAISRLAFSGPVNETVLQTRREYVFSDLLNYINVTTIKELITAIFSIESTHSELLLHDLHLPGNGSSLLTVLQTPSIYNKDSSGQYVHSITTTSLPDIFRVFKLLHKATLLIKALKIDSSELSWFLSNHSISNTFDFNLLPIDSDLDPIAFSGWETMYRILGINRQFIANDNASFLDLLSFASTAPSTPDLLEQVNRLTGWSIDDLQTLHHDGLNYCTPQTYEWLIQCFRYKKICGMPLTQLQWFAEKDSGADEYRKAITVKDAVKAKYSVEQWQRVFKPLMNTLREKKRKALVDFLIEHSQRNRNKSVIINGQSIKNPEYWFSSNDLFGWFCIDVEMCSDQLTSRIKQAMSSCQLFIQRCFLNLEPRVPVTIPDANLENNWEHWKWMKNYRIWEANRKIFLYPENWIEPELRLDKSPFFNEFETDLLSKELTDENAESAVLRYIEKLELVANLTVCSIFHEVDTGVNNLHVIARTKDNPPRFFYRTCNLIYNKWSAWEVVQADIHSEQVVPYIYNRKLYLFWLIFQEKPLKTFKLPAVNADGGAMTEPPKMLQIELGWSLRTTTGWTAASISKKRLIHPWERPSFSYNIKPRYKKNDNTLWIDLFITTSREFNDKVFYDQYSNAPKPFRRFTQVPFNETFRPWHSSSFVFDGAVKNVLLRGIPSVYFSPAHNEERQMSSYEYVKANFEQDGRDINLLVPYEPRLVLPSGMHYHYNRITNNTNDEINTRKFTVLNFDRKSTTLLNNASSPFEAVLCQQGIAPINNLIRPLFYQDSSRAYFIKQDVTFFFYIMNQFFDNAVKMYSVMPFFHPWVEVFQQEINRDGITGLYARDIQRLPWKYTSKSKIPFSNRYQPAGSINADAADKEEVDFSRTGAYSQYNWELFFHIPMLVANRLSQNQRFEEAMKWYHYIFNPTNTENYGTPQRFWITKPFFETNGESYKKQRIDYILNNIADFREQLTEWKNHPFRPHLIAQHRSVVYQKAIVMKYIDNIIAWGDQLFRRETIEAINEASLLYVLASELLGDRPSLIPPLKLNDRSFNELEAEGTIDQFGNTNVEVRLENTLGLPLSFQSSYSPASEPLPRLETLYFGIPANEKLLSYWDLVQDRLYKIRHSMNIHGVKRQLPLFAPPIDPALLVKAAASGIDPAGLLDYISAPSQLYRFRILASKAVEFCNDVSVLGDKLLEALERNDAEELALLRATNSVTLLENMKTVKKLFIDEATKEAEAYSKLYDIFQLQLDHKAYLAEKIEEEKKAESWGDHVTGSNIAAKVCKVLSKGFSLLPGFSVGANGVGGTPKSTVSFGDKASKFFDKAADVCEYAEKGFKFLQELMEKKAKDKRNKAENEMKKKIDEINKEHFEQKQLVAEIRINIAQKEYEYLEKQIETIETEQQYLETKYTNVQLYQWSISQIATIYFRAYQLAYDMAKRAEKSYHRELGINNVSFIQFGYWDSLKKGLLAADKLSHDIRRMESSYFEYNRRELEITKNLSLSQLAPQQLLSLSLTGRCQLDIDEWMYNLDYPGHYRRRIKSVALTVLCDVDEYTNINCNLRLLRSEIRVSALTGDDGYAKVDEDPRFTSLTGSAESIATSHGINDNGLFRLEFNDERFLPFEGEGAISSWDIEMPQENNCFDFRTIKDIILHISYTAADGGDVLASSAKDQLQEVLSGEKTILFGMRNSFPERWETFLHTEADTDQVMEFSLTKDSYPFLDRFKDISIASISIVIQGTSKGSYNLEFNIPGESTLSAEIPKDPSFNNINYLENVFSGSVPATGEFSFKIRRSTVAGFRSLQEDELIEVYLVIDYK